MRALRGGDTQAATKSSLADIEKRKKGKFFFASLENCQKCQKFLNVKLQVAESSQNFKFCVWSTKKPKSNQIP
jgi:hypothetical protein